MAEKKGGEGGQRVVYSSPYSALFAARFEGARPSAAGELSAQLATLY